MFKESRYKTKYRTIFDKGNGTNSEISVIIPVYNYEDYIIETLESVKEQTIKDINLVVTEDA